jgi:hypothetical protein
MGMPGRGKKAKNRSTGGKNSILTGKKLEEAVSRVLCAVFVTA